MLLPHWAVVVHILPFESSWSCCYSRRKRTTHHSSQEHSDIRKVSVTLVDWDTHHNSRNHAATKGEMVSQQTPAVRASISKCGAHAETEIPMILR